MVSSSLRSAKFSSFSGLLLGLLALLACGPKNHGEASATASGVGEAVADLIPRPKLKTAAELAVLQETIRVGAFEGIKALGFEAGRANTEAVVVKMLAQSGGMPRHQLRQMLTDLLASAPARCGGANCERIFGLKVAQLEDFLDEQYRSYAANPRLKAPQSQSLREAIVGSFAREPADGPMPQRPSPLRFAYKLADQLHMAGLMVGHGNEMLTLGIKPNDLARTHRLFCNGDECEAELLAPFMLRANIPLPINLRSYVTIKYLRATHPGTGLIHQEAEIGGRLTPIDIAGILTVNFDFIAEVEKSEATGQRSVVRNVSCSGLINCNLPFLSLGANFDKSGIVFDQFIHLNDFGGQLTKVGPYAESSTRTFTYEELSAGARALARAAADHLVGDSTSSVDPDIYWGAFTGAKAQ